MNLTHSLFEKFTGGMGWCPDPILGCSHRAETIVQLPESGVDHCGSVECDADYSTPTWKSPAYREQVRALVLVRDRFIQSIVAADKKVADARAEEDRRYEEACRLAYVFENQSRKRSEEEKQDLEEYREAHHSRIKRKSFRQLGHVGLHLKVRRMVDMWRVKMAGATETKHGQSVLYEFQDLIGRLRHHGY